MVDSAQNTDQQLTHTTYCILISSMNKLLFKPKQKDWSIPNKGSKISHGARSPMTTEIPAAIKWSKLLSSECWNPIRSSCDPPVHRVPHGGQSESLWDCSNGRRNLRAHRGTFRSAVQLDAPVSEAIVQLLLSGEGRSQCKTVCLISWLVLNDLYASPCGLTFTWWGRYGSCLT